LIRCRRKRASSRSSLASRRRMSAYLLACGLLGKRRNRRSHSFTSQLSLVWSETARIHAGAPGRSRPDRSPTPWAGPCDSTRARGCPPRAPPDSVEAVSHLGRAT
jgi:hypothetical protein